MVAAILRATREGGDQALAAPRGEGKTTICEGVILFCVLTGALRFPAFFGATASDAMRSLDNIRGYLDYCDEMPLMERRIGEDYPEVCAPVRALEGIPSRARGMLVTGKNQVTGEKYSQQQARFLWTGEEIQFPHVPGSRCAGTWIAARGLDSAVRGLKKGALRPDLAVIDDPDTENTAVSEEQAAKLERRIDRAIGGLGTGSRKVSRVMITTIQSRVAVSARFTNREEKPSWMGRRFALLLRPPERSDLWDEYTAERQANQRAGDATGRKAAAFYREHREAMDLLADVANPHSYDSRFTADGTPLQESTLQAYFDFVADRGQFAALCELQNDPPEEEGAIEIGLTAQRIQRQLSYLPRGVIPEGVEWITQGIDLQKAGAHFAVRAWRQDFTGWTIDYGFQEARGTVYGSDEGVEAAIIRCILERMEAITRSPYKTRKGEAVDVHLTLIDSGWQAPAVYDAVRRIGGPGIFPAKGFGRSNGCAGPSFYDVTKSTRDRRVGEGWLMSAQHAQGLWLVCADADKWKTFEHQRWMTERDKPGAMHIFGEQPGDPRRLSPDERQHHGYAQHLMAESEVEEMVKGVLKRRWKTKHASGQARNHFLDASYLSCVGASMLGAKLLRSTEEWQKQQSPTSSSTQRRERERAAPVAGPIQY